MGAVRSVVGLTLGAVLGASALVVYRAMRDTGKPLPEAVAELPAELERLYVELKTKALEFIETGRAAHEGAEEDPSGHLAESGAGQQ